MYKPRKKRHLLWSVSKTELSRVINQKKLFKDVLAHFGLKDTISNYIILKKRITADKIDTYHIVHSKERTGKAVRKITRTLDEILVKNSTYQYNKLLKKRLIDAKLLKEICYECNQLPEWNNKPLVLQLDHINGDHYDNRLENLRILCPNCHTQTETYCVNKNVK